MLFVTAGGAAPTGPSNLSLATRASNLDLGQRRTPKIAVTILIDGGVAVLVLDAPVRVARPIGLLVLQVILHEDVVFLKDFGLRAALVV